MLSLLHYSTCPLAGPMSRLSCAVTYCACPDAATLICPGTATAQPDSRTHLTAPPSQLQLSSTLEPIQQHSKPCNCTSSTCRPRQRKTARRRASGDNNSPTALKPVQCLTSQTPLQCVNADRPGSCAVLCHGRAGTQRVSSPSKPFDKAVHQCNTRAPHCSKVHT